MTLLRAHAFYHFAPITPAIFPKCHRHVSLLQHVDAQMIKTGFNPNTHRSNHLMESLLQRGELSQARQLLDGMPHRNRISTNTLISGFVKSGNLSDARQMFDRMTDRNMVSWTILIGGYAQSKRTHEAFELFSAMRSAGAKPDHVTYVSLLLGYVDEESLNLLFEEMPERDCVTFNALITGHAKDGSCENSMRLFLEMQSFGLKPSEFMFAAVLSASTGLGVLGLGQQIHGLVMLEMGKSKESLDLFRELQFKGFDRKQYPFSIVLNIAAAMPNLEMGRQIHAQAILTSTESDILVGNSLIDMYAKCSSMETAEMIFRNRMDRNSVSWTAMISGHVQSGSHEEAIKLFSEMHRANVRSDQATFSSVLRALASLALIGLAKQLHS
ncbi:hypothetical protein AAC387_Pa08g2258 [Persea americana]